MAESPTPNFLDLRGSVPVPEHLRGLDWQTIRLEARRIHVERRIARWNAQAEAERANR